MSDPYDDSDYDVGDDASDDSASDDDSGDRLVENKKLRAIQNVKSQVTTSQGSLAQWSTSESSGVGGGGSVDSLSGGLRDDVWNSPAADEFSTKISESVNATDTLLADILTTLNDAEYQQKKEPGEKVEPDSQEVNWRADP